MRVTTIVAPAGTYTWNVKFACCLTSKRKNTATGLKMVVIIKTKIAPVNVEEAFIYEEENQDSETNKCTRMTKF